MSVQASWEKDFEEKYGFEHIFEENMIQAIKVYFQFGLEPGSCTTCILRGELEEARARAHPHLLRCEFNSAVTNIERLYHTIRELLGEMVLEYSLDPNHGYKFPGINNIPEHEQAMIFLESPLLQYWMKEAADAEFIR